MERVADYIVERIAEAGVGHVFMITGRGILYLSDAVAKNEKIQAVAVHHEYIDQRTTNQPSGPRNENVAVLGQLQLAGYLMDVLLVWVHLSHDSALMFISAFRISRSSTVVTLMFFSEPGTMCISRPPSSAISVQEATELVIPFCLASSWAAMIFFSRKV